MGKLTVMTEMLITQGSSIEEIKWKIGHMETDLEQVECENYSLHSATIGESSSSALMILIGLYWWCSLYENYFFFCIFFLLVSDDLAALCYFLFGLTLFT
jgi:hypothetical protein